MSSAAGHGIHNASGSKTTTPHSAPDLPAAPTFSIAAALAAASCFGLLAVWTPDAGAHTPANSRGIPTPHADGGSDHWPFISIETDTPVVTEGEGIVLRLKASRAFPEAHFGLDMGVGEGRRAGAKSAGVLIAVDGDPEHFSITRYYGCYHCLRPFAGFRAGETEKTVIVATGANEDSRNGTVTFSVRPSLDDSYWIRGQGGLTAGIGPSSVTVQIRNLDNPGYGAPNRPRLLSIEPGATSVTARWYRPSFTGGWTVRGYDVRYRTSATGSWTTLSRIGADWRDAMMSRRIQGLSVGDTVRVQVRAVSPGGMSGWSPEVAATTVRSMEQNDEETGGPPLTAQFEDAPVAHDGEGIFAVELRLSEDVPGLGFQNVLDALRAENGRVTRARRIERGRNQRWRIEVQPDSPGEVVLTLAPAPACGVPGAICAPDGRRLSGSAVVLVPGPVPSPSEAVSATTAPDAPAALAFSDVAPSGFTVSWEPPADNGSPITGYRYQVRFTQFDFIVTDVETTDTSASIYSLAPEQEFDVRVKAVNGNGEGPWSPWIARTLPADRPPVFSGSGEFTVAEGETAVGTVTAVDPDFGARTVFSLKGTDAALFSITDDGLLSFREAPEAGNDYRITVVATGFHPDYAVSRGRQSAERDYRVRVTGVANQVAAPSLPALTAAFEGVPAEHDGQSVFTFRLRFNAEPDVSFRVLRDQSFQVTGGQVRRARQVDRRNDLREIHIQPSGNGDITVTLTGGRACGTHGAICTADGRALSNTLVANIQGPPSLSVADAQAEEGADEALRFLVTLSRAASAPVTVAYATADGTATAGADYTATSGTLTFAAGETTKTISVPVLADAHNEHSETLTLVLSNPSGAMIADGEATGTISNDGPIPQAWIGRFGRTVADQVVDAVQGRLQAAPTPGHKMVLAGIQLNDGTGQQSDGQQTAGLDAPTLNGADLLTSSSFALTAKTGSGERTWSVWGRGAVTSFDGREGDLNLDGTVTSALLGADWTWDYGATSDGEVLEDGRWRSGLLLSHSRSNGSYDGATHGDGEDATGMAGEVEAHLTGLFPWVRRALNHRLDAWGLAGYGLGELTVTPELPDATDAAPLTADLNLWMAAGGLRGTLMDGGSNGLSLTGKTDAMVVGTSSGQVTGDDGHLASAQVTVTRLRMGLEASRPLQLVNGATLTPSLEAALRHDGGDAETGFGLDLGGGIALSHPQGGLEAELRGRGLLSHAADGFRDRGFSASLAWRQQTDSQLGAALSLSQTMGGAAAGGADALLSRVTLDGLATNGEDHLNNQRLELKLSYGLPAFNDRFTLTPELGLGLYDNGRDYRIGWRLTQPDHGESFAFSFDATRREDNHHGAAPEHGVQVGLNTRF